jgi:hypothetical protein
MGSFAKMSWMGRGVTKHACTIVSLIRFTPDTSFQILPWVIAPSISNRPTYLDYEIASSGAPVLASVSKGVPGIFMDCHMMVSQPEKVRLEQRCAPPFLSN